ncbi:MAG: DUF4157 domain-containing protein, partial [Chloroflexota bacterium]
MSMAEQRTKDTEKKEEARHRKKAQPIYDQLKQAAVPEDSQANQAISVLPRAEQASLLNSPGLLSAQKDEAILELQQTYGNRYVQRLAEAGREAADTPNEDIISRIGAQRGSGKPLEPEVRSQMETGLGCDFSQVRTHTDTEANKLCRELNAKAFTTGKDIFFKEGGYQPASRGSRQLLTHELTHVMQQESGGNRCHRGTGTKAFQTDTHRCGANLVQQSFASSRTGPDMVSIYRQKEG